MRSKRFVSAAAALMMLVSTALPAFADEGADSSYDGKADALGRYFARVILDTDYSYTVEDPEIRDYPDLPRKIDLRNVDGKNYVTPVKNQGQTGNCWAYSAAACAETSILYERGIDLNECDESQVLDFSERQFAWFVGVLLGENSPYPSQTGEGSIRLASYFEMQKDNPNYEVIFKDLFSGGYDEYLVSMLSTRQGPVDERLVPNLDDVCMSGTVDISEVIKDPAECESIEEFTDPEKSRSIPFSSKAEFLEIISDGSLLGNIPLYWNSDTSWYVGNGKYWTRQIDSDAAKSLDWSVDDSYRFSDYTVENIVFCQDLAGTDETGGYVLNENVLNTIKHEIASGRPAMIGLYYDSGKQTDNLRFVNLIDKNGEHTNDPGSAEYLCYYWFYRYYYPDDPESVNRVGGANHAVTIVGYDDDFPKEYFNDPKGNIKSNGAFIAKNSWGSAESYTPYGNNGDGFFYISYYDQSLKKAMTVDFKLQPAESAGEEKLSYSFEHLYDVIPAPWYEACSYEDAASANVYHCENDQKLVSVASLCSHPNNTIRYDVYILNDGYTGPTDGVLAASKTVRENLSGYHSTELDEPLYLKKGTSFSVVVTIERENGTKEILFKNDGNEKYGMQHYESNKSSYVYVHGTDEGFVPYNIYFSKAVINKGESFVYSDGEWFDWKDIVDVMHTCGVDPDSSITNSAELTDFDNFSIHAYTESAYFSTDHRIIEPQEKPYNPGDEVVCTVSLRKELDRETGSCEVFVNGTLIGSISELKKGETAELEYTYTVTEEDLKRGYFENRVRVFTTDSGGSYREFDLLEPLNITTVTAEVSEQEQDSDSSSESEPDSSSESEPDSSSESEPDSSSENQPDTSSESRSDNSEKPSGRADSNPKTGAAAGVTFIALAAAAGVMISKIRRGGPQS